MLPHLHPMHMTWRASKPVSIMAFFDVSDATKTLEAYITVIEAFAGRHCNLFLVPHLPTMFGNMRNMLAGLPLVEPQDQVVVHWRRCIAVGCMLLDILFKPMLLSSLRDCNNYPSTFWGMRCLFKDLTEADFKPTCQKVPKPVPPRPEQPAGPTSVDVEARQIKLSQPMLKVLKKVQSR